MPAPLSLSIRATIQELLKCGMTHEAIADDLSIPYRCPVHFRGRLSSRALAAFHRAPDGFF